MVSEAHSDLIQACWALVSRAADHAVQRHTYNAYDLNARLNLAAQPGQESVALRGGQNG